MYGKPVDQGFRMLCHCGTDFRTEIRVCYGSDSGLHPTCRQTTVSRHDWTDMKNRSITVQGTDVAITSRHEQDYISLTDRVKNFDGGSALIEQWLKNKDTVLFLGV
jgi:hypothetical protein